MKSLQGLISILLIWEKVDSHIENREYNIGVKPEGDKLAINLNKAVDKWAEQAREIRVKNPNVQDT